VKKLVRYGSAWWEGEALTFTFLVAPQVIGCLPCPDWKLGASNQRAIYRQSVCLLQHEERERDGLQGPLVQSRLFRGIPSLS
jgi:hypothetical protein